MLKSRRFCTLCILIVSALLISGCWDSKQIENRGFTLGIAIDHAVPSDAKGQNDLRHVTQEAGTRKYRVTYELPKLSGNAEGEGEGDTPVLHYLYAGEGESMFAILRAINTKTYTELSLEDIQVLVFSESVAREGIGNFLDFYLRNHEMRRHVKLLVTPGRAEDILTSKIPAEEENSTYIAKIEKNSNSIPKFASKTDLGDIAEAIRNKRSFFLPEVVIEHGEVKLTKAVIFNKDKKMAGVVNEYEIIGGKILRKALKYGFFTVPNPANPDKLAGFELLESSIKVTSHVKDDTLWFSVEAKFVGNVGENTATTQKVLDPVFLAELEQALADQFTNQVYEGYRRHQEAKADALGLGSLVYRQHPEYWEKVKDRWDDEIFPAVPLEVNIKVVVRRPGLTN